MERKCNITNNRYFDVNGFHPNVQSAKDPLACLDYVKKDGDFIIHGEPGLGLDPRSSWADAIAAATRDDFLSAVRSSYPRDYVINYDKIISFAESHYKPVEVPYQPSFTEFNVDDLFPELTEWVDTNIK